MGLSHAPETRYRRRTIRGRTLYEDEHERISTMARGQRLHSRPNTLAQTNCHRSFSACNSAADHTFPVTAFTRHLHKFVCFEISPVTNVLSAL